VLTKIGFFDWRETRTRHSCFRNAVYDPDKISDETIREYLNPGRYSNKAYKSFKKFLLAGNPQYTIQVVPELKKFTKPTLVLWAEDDTELSVSWGKKLAEDIPGVRQFETIPKCGHFWQEEKPLVFARKIGNFLREYL